jgi:integrase
MSSGKYKLSTHGFGKHTPGLDGFSKAPKFLHLEIDFRGNPRWKYREGKGPRIPMRDEGGKWLVPGTRAFREKYDACRYGKAAPAAIEAVIAPAPGMLPHSNAASLAWLAEQYLLKAAFKKAATKKQHRTVLDRFVKKNGGLPYKKFTKKDVLDIQQEVASGQHEGATGEAPAMANRIVGVLRSLYDWAIAYPQQLLEDNPCDGVKRIEYDDETAHVWTEEEMARFEAYWPLGSRERLAYALMVCTGQASCDVVLMGKQHIKKGKIDGKRLKTGNAFSVPLSPELKEAIAAADKAKVTGDLTFIVQANGKAYKEGSFGQWFRAACDEAQTPDCTCHGLRHVASNRVLERCARDKINPIPILMGAFGYTLGVAERYVRKANLAHATDGLGHYFGKEAA